jgi:hypothetical protein
MSDQQGIHPHSPSRSLLEVIDLNKVATLPLLPFLSQICAYLSLTQEILNVIYHFCCFPLAPLAAPRGFGKAITHLFCCVFTFTVLLHLILYGMLGVTSHLASQAHTVVRNTCSIMSAVCALPVPYKNVLCTGIGNELSPLVPDAGHVKSWHPFLINEDIHGPTVDFAIHKAANVTTIVLALIRASDLTQCHGLSDKLKDFLQCAWASELSTASHVALVKTVIDE